MNSAGDFTYVVDRRATIKSSCESLEGLSITNPIPTGTGSLVIENATGGTVIDNTMVAYISHGTSGYGAFSEQGGTTRINSGGTDADMQNNSNTTYGVNNFTNSFVQKDRVAPASGDTGFDELVWYRPDLKNTCCLGNCIPLGFRVDGNLASGALRNPDDGCRNVNGDGIPDLIMLGKDTGNKSGIIFMSYSARQRAPASPTH